MNPKPLSRAMRLIVPVAISETPCRRAPAWTTGECSETIIVAMPPRKKAVRRRKAAPASVGLSVAETRQAADGSLDGLAAEVERDGGAVLGRYRDPFGGTPLMLAALPVAGVEPTPYQRDPSDTHVKRLMGVVEALGRFLDPIIAVRKDDRYWTPNGNHRLQALKKLGVKT